MFKPIDIPVIGAHRPILDIQYIDSLIITPFVYHWINSLIFPFLLHWNGLLGKISKFERPLASPNSQSIVEDKMNKRSKFGNCP